MCSCAWHLASKLALSFILFSQTILLPNLILITTTVYWVYWLPWAPKISAKVLKQLLERQHPRMGQMEDIPSHLLPEKDAKYLDSNWLS